MVKSIFENGNHIDKLIQRFLKSKSQVKKYTLLLSYTKHNLYKIYLLV